MNKPIIAAILLFGISTGLTNAQIILHPEATGDVCHQFTYRFAYRADIPMTAMSTSDDFIPGTPGIHAGKLHDQTQSGNMSTFFHSTQRTWTQHGILEFRIDQTAGGTPFPLPGMTENNWEAHLNGLVLEEGPEGVLFQLQMVDQSDTCEDGAIIETDFDCGEDFVATVFDTIPDAGTEIDPIDVTSQLRRDLFGAGTGDATSGFILKPGNPLLANAFITLGASSPFIEITINGTPAPTATATPVPTHTPAATPTPQPTAPPGVDASVELSLSHSTFHPGDAFLLTASISNHLPTPMINAPFVVLLDAFGSYYWYPDWTDTFSVHHVDLPAGVTTLTILDFIWPSGVGSAAGLTFYGAVLTSDFSAIVGAWDSVPFNWSE